MVNNIKQTNKEELQNLLKLNQLSPSIKRRIEEEFYVNKSLAVRFSQCKTEKERDKLYYDYYRLELSRKSSLMW